MKKQPFDPSRLKEEWGRFCEETSQDRFAEISARAAADKRRRKKPHPVAAIAIPALCAAAAVAVIVVGLPLARNAAGSAPMNGEAGAAYTGDVGGEYRFAADEPDGAPAEAPAASPVEAERADLPGRNGAASPQSGTLTAGHWNDNDNWAFWLSLQNGQKGFERYLRDWGLSLTRRLTVNTAPGAAVRLKNADGDVLFAAVADNRGVARLFWNVTESGQTPAAVEVTSDGAVVSATLTEAQQKERDLTLTVEATPTNAGKALDIALVIDTTGSMGDELAYLQTELQSVLDTVKIRHGNCPVRLSITAYRDVEDEYVVRSFPFSNNISARLRDLQAQSADGGGDYEEAVEQALDKAINDSDWSDASAKLLLLVLDAPPHNNSEVRGQLAGLMAAAAEKGIRILPVTSSGTDKSTEFLMRALAAATGGDYVFLTDDSGVGGSHIEPTTGDYTVEKLNALLLRLIGGYLE